MTLPPLQPMPGQAQGEPAQPNPGPQVILMRFIEEWLVYPNGQMYFKGKWPVGGYPYQSKKKGKVKKGKDIEIKEAETKDVLG